MRRALLVVGCALAGLVRAAPQVEPWPLPAAPGSAQPNITLAREGVLVSWIEPGAGAGHVLRMTSCAGPECEPARTVAQGDDWFVNWADFPSMIELEDGTLVAHWLQRQGQGTYAYGVRLSRSRDRGRTWSPPFVPHDASATEHGFVALWPEPGEGFGLAWLDGRETSGGGQDVHAHGAGAMTLRTARYGEGSRAVAERRLDARTCDCCPTDAARAGDGVVVVYRDREDDERRDIVLRRRDAKGSWSGPIAVAHDGWRVPACPVNGPAVAAADRDVYVAWYTAAADRPRVLLARSRDGGQRLAKTLVLDARSPLGRVDVAVAGPTVWVSWLATTQGRQALRVARFDRALGTREDATVAVLPPGRATGVPRIGASRGRLHVVWTANEGARTRVAGAVVH